MCGGWCVGLQGGIPRSLLKRRPNITAESYWQGYRIEAPLSYEEEQLSSRQARTDSAFGDPNLYRFPTAGLPPKIHSGRWNLQVLDNEAHKRAHRRLRRMENALRTNTNRYTITARFLNNLRRDLEQPCEE